MSYIVIENTGELPVWGIRLLGLSNKSGNQIGQFGTGLKEAIALLSREGCLPTIFSGLLRVDFSIQTIDGQSEICFRLSEKRDRFESNTWYGMALHPNYGKADWKDPWMALREIVCNAQDAGGLRHDVYSLDPSGTEGTTRVYIPLKPALLEAYSLVEKRLLFLRSRETVLESGANGRAMKKMEDNKLQIYHKGVWIQESTKTSLYDYELYGIKLNESRSCDWWSVEWEISMIIGKYTIEQATEALDRLLIKRESFYEFDFLGRAADVSIESKENNWVKAFTNIYGDNAVVTTTDAYFYDRLKSAGYKPVVVANDGLYRLLVAAGCKCAIKTLSSADRTFESVRTPTPETQAVFDKVWHDISTLELVGDKVKPTVMIFRQRPEDTELLLGSYDKGICYVNEEVVGSKQELMACVEEIAHHVTNANDCSRLFQTFLVTLATRCLYG